MFPDELTPTQRAHYEAAIEAGVIDGLDDGGVVRRAFLAGWLGRESAGPFTRRPAGSFYASSMFGRETGRGLVELTLGDEKTQVPPAKAREIAAMMLEAASAAEGDEVLMKVLERAGMSRARTSQVLLAHRQERAIIERRARREAREAIAFDQEQADLDT